MWGAITPHLHLSEDMLNIPRSKFHAEVKVYILVQLSFINERIIFRISCLWM